MMTITKNSILVSFPPALSPKKTAEKYLSDVKGFKDYRVTDRITEKSVIGASDDLYVTDVYVIYGWNENDEQDEDGG